MPGSYTERNIIIIKSWQNIREALIATKDHLCPMEGAHASQKLPWFQRADALAAEYKRLHPNYQYTLNVEKIKRRLTKKRREGQRRLTQAQTEAQSQLEVQDMAYPEIVPQH
ncbi:hypothetical protein HD806DRAFT_540591 [Xylariaceae sp. AK1471]|nr:hypothetical protein HD806DRAFT_540591 [Xylariaceae sp. AK1471]